MTRPEGHINGAKNPDTGCGGRMKKRRRSEEKWGRGRGERRKGRGREKRRRFVAVITWKRF